MSSAHRKGKDGGGVVGELELTGAGEPGLLPAGRSTRDSDLRWNATSLLIVPLALSILSLCHKLGPGWPAVWRAEKQRRPLRLLAFEELKGQYPLPCL